MNPLSEVLILWWILAGIPLAVILTLLVLVVRHLCRKTRAPAPGTGFVVSPMNAQERTAYDKLKTPISVPDSKYSVTPVWVSVPLTPAPERRGTQLLTAVEWRERNFLVLDDEKPLGYAADKIPQYARRQVRRIRNLTRKE